MEAMSQVGSSGSPSLALPSSPYWDWRLSSPAQIYLETNMKIDQNNPATWPTKGNFFLLHHQGPLLEWTNDIWERVEYILTDKPKYERKKRLREIRPVFGRLPEPLIQAGAACEKAAAAYLMARAAYAKARAAYDEAWAAYDEAWAAYAKARAAYAKARAAYASQLEALHRAECPNSKWNGYTIFGDKS